jgi:hypothetical protein
MTFIKDNKVILLIMKHLRSLYVIISIGAITCGFLNSCQSNDDAIDYNMDLPEEYLEVGIQHNDGLNFIFSRIQEECIEYLKNHEIDSLKFEPVNYRAIIRDAINEFCSSNPKTKEYAKFFLPVIESEDYEKSLHVNEIAPQKKELLDRIQLALPQDCNKRTLKGLKDDLQLINQEASQRLSSEDAASIYCATSTAYFTFQYWSKNYRAWYFLLNYPEILEQLEKEKLNKLSLKSTYLLTDTTSDRKSWLGILWDGFEGWLRNTMMQLILVGYSVSIILYDVWGITWC